MNPEQLKEILSKHLFWIRGEGGERANLSGANLSGADLRDANLGGANLRSVDLRSTDLRSVDLSGADLRDANLSGADLRYANLSGADLRDANLSGADLGGANLRYANLSGADLRDANLRSVDLSGASTDDIFFQISRIGSTNRMTTWNATKDIIWCGCFKGTMQEWIEKIQKTYEVGNKHRDAYLAAVLYFQTLAKVYGDTK
jgi:uncharacterized protein YjbI with pentapeptide repeats